MSTVKGGAEGKQVESGSQEESKGESSQQKKEEVPVSVVQWGFGKGNIFLVPGWEKKLGEA